MIDTPVNSARFQTETLPRVWLHMPTSIRRHTAFPAHQPLDQAHWKL